MFIINPNYPNLDTYMCGNIVAKYLTSKGFSILSLDVQSERYVFSNTDSLKKELKNAPIWVKLFSWERRRMSEWK
jgi:hypothetical protein